MIDALGLAGFFLLHRDLLELAREVAVEVRGPGHRRARCCRRAAAAAPRCPRSSATSPASRTSTRSRNELFLGRFLNEELTALPDIDLDFPRDIREVLIPRVHERYGQRALGAGRGVPDVPLARGDPRARQGARPAAGRARAGRARGRAVGGPAAWRRDVEVALGLEPSAGRRRRSSTPTRARAVRDDAPRSGWRWSTASDPDHAEAHATGRRRARYAALPGPLGVAGAAVRRGLRAAAPPLPALGRDDRLDPAADRLLPGRCRRRWRAASCASGTRTPARTPAS